MHETALVRNVADIVLEECSHSDDIVRVIAEYIISSYISDIIDQYVIYV